MSNMSYCRFENTLRDLVDCHETIESLLAGEAAPLSDTELRCAIALIEQCRDTLLLISEEQCLDLGDVDNVDAKDALNFANQNTGGQ
jgi:hypothetical protein